MFWGDSHVQQLYPLIKKLYGVGALQGHAALLAVANGCPPSEQLNSRERGFHCDAFARLALKRAEAEDIDAVFIGFNTWWAVHEYICPSVDGRCVETITLEETRRRFLDELSQHVRELKARGKQVIVSLPFPMYDKSIPDLAIQTAVFGRLGLRGAATEITLPSFRDELAAVAKAAGADVFDPRMSLCGGQSCITELNGVSIYKDSNHIAASQIGILEENLREVLKRLTFSIVLAKEATVRVVLGQRMGLRVPSPGAKDYSVSYGA